MQVNGDNKAGAGKCTVWSVHVFLDKTREIPHHRHPAFCCFETWNPLSSLTHSHTDPFYLLLLFYLKSYSPSQADVAVLDAVKTAPAAAKYPHAARWFKHITSFGAEKSSFPGEKKAASAYGPAAKAAAAPAAADDDDIDLFGSDDDEDAEAEKLKQERLAAYHAKKAASKFCLKRESDGGGQRCNERCRDKCMS